MLYMPTKNTYFNNNMVAFTPFLSSSSCKALEEN